MNERPGPASAYWLSSGPSTLPPDAYLQWLLRQSGVNRNALNPLQSPEPDSPIFPVLPGGQNALLQGMRGRFG